MMNRAGALVVMLALTTGCASVSTLNAAKPGAPLVYAGTRLDLYAINGGCCVMDRFGTQAPAWPKVDLPASALLDTVLLPFSLLSVIGVGYQAQGGL
jgi:uncharacterized protein YceK